MYFPLYIIFVVYIALEEASVSSSPLPPERWGGGSSIRDLDIQRLSNVGMDIFSSPVAPISPSLRYTFAEVFHTEWQLESERTRGVEDVEKVLGNLHKS